jgi:hypothetical protein
MFQRVVRQNSKRRHVVRRVSPKKRTTGRVALSQQMAQVAAISNSAVSQQTQVNPASVVEQLVAQAPIIRISSHMQM